VVVGLRPGLWDFHFSRSCSSLAAFARINSKRGGLMSRMLAAVVAMCCVVSAAGARAQEQQSFKTLIGRGFDIKSVTFVRGETTENREVFLVTLQQGKSVAVCYFAAANWINLSSATLEDSKRCDVR